MAEIRGGMSKDRELGELKRDLQAALKKVPPFELKTFNGAYTEPLYIRHKSKPQGVVLLNAVNVRDQEDPEELLSGGFCHSTWEGGANRIRINAIDGFTPDPTVLFRMTFLVVG